MFARPCLMPRLASARRLAAALTLAAGTVQAGAPAVDDVSASPEGARAAAPGANSPTPFNLGLTSTASLRVAWRNVAYGVGVGMGVGVEALALDTPPVPEPASASLALAGLAVLGALMARRRLNC